MPLFRLRPFLLGCCTLIIFSCSSTKKSGVTLPGKQISSLRFLGEYDIPYGLSFNNTTVGGLSSIDYDSMHNRYYFVCDDRSAINPARFYTAEIRISNNKIDTVLFTHVTYMRQTNGEPYPNSKQDPFNTPDPESMRYNAAQNQLVWSSEGERNFREHDSIIADPAIRMIGLDGKFADSIPIPPNLHMQAIEKGPRQNGVFEGMTFADNYKTLYVSVEEPLWEDGPRADVMDNNACIRILKFDVNSKRNLGQYAYKLDPVAFPANPVSAYKINGVPEILSLDNNRLLVVERSYSTGRLACVVKVFIADLAGASDIAAIPSLKERNDYKPASKKLLINMADLGIYVDNIEGITFGPVLPNGHRTLLFVADNNFNPLEKSQVFLFEVVE